MQFRSLLPIALLASSVAVPALADTYTNYVVTKSDGATFTQGTNSGSYTLVDGQIDNRLCGGNDCYIVGNVLTGEQYITGNPPTLPGAFTPNAATTTCATPTGFYGNAYCNGGHEILIGNYAGDTIIKTRIFDGPSPLDEIYVADATGIILTSNGNLYFNDTSDDTENVLINNTTTSVTPEPSSIALFGTGVFGLLGAVRRRIKV